MKEPVEVEAMRMAKYTIKDEIIKAGSKVCQYDIGEITAAAKALLASWHGNNIREKAWESVAKRVYAFDYTNASVEDYPTGVECQAADQYVQRHAYRALSGKLGWSYPRVVRNYMMLMARCYHGSMATDHMLQKLGCYPSWLR